MIWTLAFVILLSSLKEINAQKRDCYTDIYFLYKCDLRLDKLSLPDSFTQLEEFCRQMSFYYSCYHYNYVDYPEDLLCGATLIFDRAEPIIVKLCTKGDKFRETYLQHAPCLGSVDQEKCAMHSDIVYNYYINRLPLNASEDDKGLRDFVIDNTRRNHNLDKRLKPCIMATSKLYCYAESILKMCGLEPGLLYGQLISRSNPLSVLCNETNILPSKIIYDRVAKEMQYWSSQKLDDILLIPKL